MLIFSGSLTMKCWNKNVIVLFSEFSFLLINNAMVVKTFMLISVQIRDITPFYFQAADCQTTKHIHITKGVLSIIQTWYRNFSDKLFFTKTKIKTNFRKQANHHKNRTITGKYNELKKGVLSPWFNRESKFPKLFV